MQSAPAPSQQLLLYVHAYVCGESMPGLFQHLSLVHKSGTGYSVLDSQRSNPTIDGTTILLESLVPNWL